MRRDGTGAQAGMRIGVDAGGHADFSGCVQATPSPSHDAVRTTRLAYSADSRSRRTAALSVPQSEPLADHERPGPAQPQRPRSPTRVGEPRPDQVVPDVSRPKYRSSVVSDARAKEASHS